MRGCPTGSGGCRSWPTANTALRLEHRDMLEKEGVRIAENLAGIPTGDAALIARAKADLEARTEAQPYQSPLATADGERVP
jgi:hypothetical protein